MDNRKSLILDTSAIIAFLAGEKCAEKILKVLSKASIPFIALSELYYIIWNRKGKAEADTMFGIVKSWNVPILYPNERIILDAGRIKSVYKLGISDSYIAAFTCENNGALITKDKDFEIIQDEIDVTLLD